MDAEPDGVTEHGDAVWFTCRAPGAAPRIHAESIAGLAREWCGCVACVGGYSIGGRTIAMGAEQPRPSSCLAAEFAAGLIRGDLVVAA